MALREVKELTVYIKAYRVAMGFFEISEEENSQLTSQNSEVGKMM